VERKSWLADVPAISFDSSVTLLDFDIVVIELDVLRPDRNPNFSSLVVSWETRKQEIRDFLEMGRTLFAFTDAFQLEALFPVQLMGTMGCNIGRRMDFRAGPDYLRNFWTAISPFMAYRTWFAPVEGIANDAATIASTNFRFIAPSAVSRPQRSPQS
jgi:hypothetical protein